MRRCAVTDILPGGAMNRLEDEMLAGHTNVTGVLERYNFGETDHELAMFRPATGRDKGERLSRKIR